MAFIVRRSRALASRYSQVQLPIMSTTLSRQCLKPAYTFSLNVRNLGTVQKDELYRQVTIEVKGHDLAILNSYQKFTAMAAGELGVNITKIYEPPRVIARMSLMKSVFVHKRHFHQYEMRTLYRVFEIKYITGSTASTFLEYIQRNLPEGVAMKVTKHQLEKFPEHIKPPSTAAVSGDTTRSVEEGSSEPADKASIDQDTSESTKVVESSNNNSTAGESATASTGIVHSSKVVKSKQRSKVSADINSSSSEAPASNTSVSKSKTKKERKSDNPTTVDS
ncbi:hypothetical protein BsWGS_10412 [Bradybaena similaris]